MTYYLLMKDDTEKDTINSTILWVRLVSIHSTQKMDFKILMNIVEHYPERLEEISIFDQKMRDYTIEEFLDKIKGLKVK